MILFTVDESRNAISEAIQAGVSGYLLKDASAEELVDAAKHALEGKAVIHPQLTRAFIEEVQIAEKRPDAPPCPGARRRSSRRSPTARPPRRSPATSTSRLTR